MNYGYFDVKNKEYVITRPDTPTPWMNYLGNGQFSGLISNNAGGLLFDKDPGNRRLTRYKYNSLPMDRPGRYIYKGYGNRGILVKRMAARYERAGIL